MEFGTGSVEIAPSLAIGGCCSTLCTQLHLAIMDTVILYSPTSKTRYNVCATVPGIFIYLFLQVTTPRFPSPCYKGVLMHTYRNSCCLKELMSYFCTVHLRQF